MAVERENLLRVTRIYAEDAALEFERGREIVARWPDAQIVPIASHWQIPEVHGDEPTSRDGCASRPKRWSWV